MLKRKFIRAGFFSNVLLVLLAVNGSGKGYPVSDSSQKATHDPFIRQMQAFDSSFIYLTEIPDSLQAGIPRIRMNPNATKFVKDYIAKNGVNLVKIKETGLRHLNMIDSIFSIYKVPIELKYLAVIESQLKSKAVSRVGAVGPWQFMPSTAKIFALKVSKKYDERTHYYKSTVAAARYLKDLYTEFGDWLLVIAAYNSGPGNVRKAIRYAGSKNFWALQNFLPAETRGHVKKFIATHYFYENCGSIATLTKAEVAKYRKTVMEFIAIQKMEAEKELLAKAITVKLNAATSEKEKEAVKEITNGELKLNEK